MSGAPAIHFQWEVVTSPDDGPGSRSRHCLAYDAIERTTVLFGGIIWSKGGWWSKGWALKADTWELQNGLWSQVECPMHPPARHRGAMTFDPRRGNAVLFGGQGDSGNLLRDTWKY